MLSSNVRFCYKKLPVNFHDYSTSDYVTTLFSLDNPGLSVSASNAISGSRAFQLFEVSLTCSRGLEATDLNEEDMLML